MKVGGGEFTESTDGAGQGLGGGIEVKSYKILS